MKRRKFVKGLSIGSASAGAVFLSKAPAFAQKRIRWKMATTWPPQLPVYQEAAELFAKMVSEASNKRISIKVFAGGELIPPLEVFGAVSGGSIECGVGSPYYWAGKSPVAQFFGAIPFGLNANQQNAWLLSGGGLELWRELYAGFNLVPFAFGNTGSQMAGWFKRKIGSMEDLKGIKMRLPGLGGKVMSEAGANVVLMAGGEIYTSLERGTIDAAEWVNPFQDERLGLHRAAKHYYYPGWQEPGSVLELMINKKEWEALPPDLQRTIDGIAGYINTWTLSRGFAQNGPAAKRLKEKHGVVFAELPADVLKRLHIISKEVVADIGNKDVFSKKVSSSFRTFQGDAMTWSAMSTEPLFKALRA